jgi:hypothetical protein
MVSINDISQHDLDTVAKGVQKTELDNYHELTFSAGFVVTPLATKKRMLLGGFQQDHSRMNTPEPRTL